MSELASSAIRSSGRGWSILNSGKVTPGPVRTLSVPAVRDILQSSLETVLHDSRLEMHTSAVSADGLGESGKQKH